jgi:hypothetical protein
LNADGIDVAVLVGHMTKCRPGANVMVNSYQ